MKTRLLLPVFVLLAVAAAAQAQLGNVWHNPTSTQGGVPSTMRDPASPGATVSVTFYQGVWKGGGDNQTGGTFFYRFSGGAWQSTALGFHSNFNSDQFWKATVSMPNSPGTLIEYYFAPTFDNRTSPTYLYSDNQKSATQSAAQASPYSFALAVPVPTLTVNGINANYSKSNFYIDEVRDTSFPTVNVFFSPNVGNLTAVEVFTNLNNRDRADDDYNNDGVHDGILPPNGNTINSTDTAAYFRAYAMQDNGNNTFSLSFSANRTGAYRLTGRYKVAGNPNWIWVGDSGYRDHAIIVAPKAARDMRVYELHVTNLNATGPTFAQRGTFEDLHDPTKRANLDWLDNLGINWIWFQPFHPQGIEGRQTDPATSQAYDPGSPYSIRNFWEINPLYTRNYNGGLPDPVNNPTNFAAAMTAFQNFAAASDAKRIQLMLDFPFNHTSPDVVLGQRGVEIFGGSGNPGGWQPNDQIRNRVPQFFSTNGGNGAAYSNPAANSGDIATAPDRNDFGKWSDVRDVFFGRYATLVTGFPSEESSRATVRNEGDWFDYTSLGNATIGVWRYFGDVLPYWIVQSGHRGFNSTPADGNVTVRESFDLAGIDGLRKDFGQGLPPQCMEYIINRTHSVKWNFVFMSESLDGGEVTYRSSRHFTVLNENIVFPLQSATTASGYRGVFEDRTNAYGQSLVLLNNTSHDEVPYADSWQALIRYATASTNDGAPMIMYGQEIGAGQRFQESLPQGAYDWYELNFGKYIPNFKKWNSMQPQWNAWGNNSVGVQFLYPVYSGIGKARAFSPALRSTNRWFINRTADGNPNANIFSVVKFDQPFASAAVQDVVLAFTNLDRNTTRSDTFAIPSGLGDRMGLSNNRTYNVKNIAAYLGRNNEHPTRRNTWLWGSGRTGADIRSNGVFVSLNPVPSTDSAWATTPYEAQFLKLYDTTALPTPASAPATGEYGLDGNITFTWNPVVDPEGLVPIYRLTVTRSDGPVNEYDTTATSHTIAGIPSGVTATATVRTLNPNDTSVASSPTGTSNPALSLTSTGDEDADGMNNASEIAAGMSPLDPASLFRITAVIPTETGYQITWSTAPGKTYRLERTSNLVTGPWIPVSTGLNSGSFTDTTAAGDRNFYRVRIE